MLLERAGRAEANGLLEDARLVALASGRGRMDRWNLRPPIAAAAAIATAAISVALVVALSASMIGSNGRYVPASPTSTPPSSVTGASQETDSAGPSAAAPTVTCVQLPKEFCDKAFALAREFEPSAFAEQSSILIANTCRPGSFCALGFRAVVVATYPGWRDLSDIHMLSVHGLQGPEEVSKWSASSGVPEHIVESLPPPANPSPDRHVAWTVAQVMARPTDDGSADLIVKGWLTASFNAAVRCARGEDPDSPSVSSEPNVSSCGEQDWLTNARFWPIQNGRVVQPEVGLALYNAAYRQFAPEPSESAGVAEPRFGAYLITAIAVPAIRSCPLAASPGAGSNCRPVLSWTYEVKGRIAP